MAAEQDPRRGLDDGAWLMPLADRRTLEITGDDRQSWLAGMLTNDVSKLEAGTAAYALSVNKTGRIQSDVWVLIDAERILLGIPEAHLSALHEALDHHLIMEDADLVVADATLRWWQALGAKAEEVAAVARDAGASVGVGTYGALSTALMVAPEGEMMQLTEPMLGVAGTMIPTPKATRALRIDALLPEQGVDFEPGGYPQEASLEGLAVSFDKGCYIGQEAVFMLEKRGRANKTLERLELPAGAAVKAGDELTSDDGKKAATVTRTAALDDRVIALALVRHPHNAAGTTLACGDHQATVLARP